jgi:hypothetical protein
MNANELAKERRKQGRLEKLCSNTPRCGTCGECDDRTLELHHIAGHKHDSTVAIICRNCHRKLSDDQKDHPPTPPSADEMLALIGNFLLGLADFLRLAAEKLVEFGHELIRKANGQAEVMS